MAPASDNYYRDPDEVVTSNEGSRASSFIFMPKSAETNVTETDGVEEQETISSHRVTTYAEPLGITISMVSLLLQAFIMYAVKSDTSLDADAGMLGNQFDNYTRSVLDNVMPPQHPDPGPVFFERPGLTIPYDDGLPRHYLEEPPKQSAFDESCGYHNTIPVMSADWSPVRVVVCEHQGDASVQINEWIDKLPYDGIILTPHKFYGLEYLHDSIVDKLIFLDQFSREGGSDAGCVLPIPVHHV